MLPSSQSFATGALTVCVLSCLGLCELPHLSPCNTPPGDCESEGRLACCQCLSCASTFQGDLQHPEELCSLDAGRDHSLARTAGRSLNSDPLPGPGRLETSLSLASRGTRHEHPLLARERLGSEKCDHWQGCQQSAHRHSSPEAAGWWLLFSAPAYNWPGWFALAAEEQIYLFWVG